MRPNLFSFATKELSQDAFIAWLLQWASPDCQAHDPILYECANNFATKLLSLQTEPPVKITEIMVERQWEKIDVCAEINGKYLLIIEDKTITREHSDQLERYKEVATKWCLEKNYQLVCVYLKTGSESAAILKQVKQQGFAIFGRGDFLRILNAPHITNNIFIDFKDHLQSLEDGENQFQTKPIKTWGDADWKGFYQALEKLRPTMLKWEKVDNSSGGFWNGLLCWQMLKDVALCLQIEQGRLCFKVGEVYENHSATRNHYHEIVIAHCTGRSEIRRPHFGHGTYMSIATIDRVNWLGDDDALIDMNGVNARLDVYENLYLEIIEKLKSENVSGDVIPT